MKVVYSARAEADLDKILADVAVDYPEAFGKFQERFEAIVARIARWPDAAQAVRDRPSVRMVPMIRYPYHVFYSVTGDTVAILQVLHGARQSTPP